MMYERDSMNNLDFGFAMRLYPTNKYKLMRKTRSVYIYAVWLNFAEWLVGGMKTGAIMTILPHDNLLGAHPY